MITRRGKPRACGLLGCLGLAVAIAAGREAVPVAEIDRLSREGRDIKADTWAATDALGRSLPDFEECGDARPGKFVGIFYFLWLGAHGVEGPFDLSQILADGDGDPDFGPPGAFHFWGEPELGYYLSDDPFVLRSHASMLADAGVDVIAIDVSNAVIYERQFEALCETWLEMRAEGNRTPGVMFLAHTRERETVASLYETYYRNDRFRPLWFFWRGKPLILASPDGHADEIASFFAFRKAWAWSNAEWFGDGEGKWTWLDHTPQAPGWIEPGEPEQVSVSVAEHATTNMGRSYRSGLQPPPDECRSEEGLHFAEQWDRALKVDPEFIFVTGWNEWVAQRFVHAGDRWNSMLGKPLQVGDSVFVDAYSQEFSRDIEPMRGGHVDSFYYQMVAGIRRFKGVSGPAPLLSRSPIDVDGRFDDWEGVGPEFRDTLGDAVWRDHSGWGETGRITNRMGRNDYECLKVALGDNSIYFYGRTVEDIRLPAGERGMILLVDLDGRQDSGIEGFDWEIEIGPSPDGPFARVRALGSDAAWGDRPTSSLSIAAGDCQLEVALPLAVAGPLGAQVRFRWIDNLSQYEGFPDQLEAGDAAPNRRFSFEVAAEDIPQG